MPRERMTLAVLARSRAPVSRWARRSVAPSAVLMAPPEGAAPGERVGPAGDDETWYAGPVDLLLHSGDTGHLRDNLHSGRPMLWAALKRGGLGIAGLTADPYEGEVLAGDDGLVVEALPMPEPVAQALAAFVARHHVDEGFEKRKRRVSKRARNARSGAEQTPRG